MHDLAVVVVLDGRSEVGVGVEVVLSAAGDDLRWTIGNRIIEVKLKLNFMLKKPTVIPLENINVLKLRFYLCFTSPTEMPMVILRSWCCNSALYVDALTPDRKNTSAIFRTKLIPFRRKWQRELRTVCHATIAVSDVITFPRAFTRGLKHGICPLANLPVLAWKMKSAPLLMAARKAAARMPDLRSSMRRQRCSGTLWFILGRSDGCRWRHRDDLKSTEALSDITDA